MAKRVYRHDWKPGDRPKGKDGLMERRIWDADRHKSVSIYARDPDTMQRLEDEAWAKIDAGSYKNNDRVTLDQYFKEWIKRKAASVKPITVHRYKYTYNGNIAPYLGKCKIRKIERRQVVDMMERVARSKRRKGTPGAASAKEAPKIAQANGARLVLAQILKSAMADEIIPRNVAATVPQMKRKAAPARETIHRELTDEELKAFFAYAEKSTYYQAFRFLLYTGVRAGECGALQWRDVDWLRGVVHIRRTMTRDEYGHSIVGSTTKTYTSKRDIPLNGNVRGVLEAQWELYQTTHGAIDMMAPVFPNERGGFAYEGPIGGALQCVLEQMEAAGESIQRFTPHAFRDTFASKAIRSGVV